jgi:predicted O-linked N-acetylglucosamine transferase (SPINDLY family)
LKGHTQDSRPGIFAEGCAPIQVNYLGYPGTMGAGYMDYIIADKIVIPPESRPCYTEKVVWLPYSYQANDSKRGISSRTFTRQAAGLPERGFVFCCFNNSYKILPETFDVWTRMLKAVDGSVLWLLEDNPVAARNLRNEAVVRGLDARRLIFAKRLSLEEHLARHKLADLFIDTWPYNAHTTASDALWAGLPLLTSIGRSFASRVTASLLTSLGLPELITRSKEDYEAAGIALALNPARLAGIQKTLTRNRASAPLFDGKMFARHLEAAYEAIHARQQSGQPPDDIEVPAQGFRS